MLTTVNDINRHCREQDDRDEAGHKGAEYTVFTQRSTGRNGHPECKAHQKGFCRNFYVRVVTVEVDAQREYYEDDNENTDGMCENFIYLHHILRCVDLLILHYLCHFVDIAYGDVLRFQEGHCREFVKNLFSGGYVSDVIGFFGNFHHVVLLLVKQFPFVSGTLC